MWSRCRQLHAGLQLIDAPDYLHVIPGFLVDEGVYRIVEPPEQKWGIYWINAE